MIYWHRDQGRNLLIMLGFGVLSVILGYIRFSVPGMEGGGSDMREIGILLSILFLPNWIYILGVAIIGSLNLPPHNLEVSTILMHCTASLFAWFSYQFIKNKTDKVYLQGIFWTIMVIAYYIFFLIPTLVIVFYLFRVIKSTELIANYKNVLYAYRFELFTSASVTTLFLVLFRTSRILEIRNEELEQALMKSEESDRLKTAFLNNINHEIRTPLNGIIGFTNLLTDPDLDNEHRKEYNKIIFTSSNQLLSIISNILEFSKINTGQLKLTIVPVSVKELFESIYLGYSSLAKEKKILFEMELNERYANDIIKTDKNSLLQILENLINNAFKFTREGSVKVIYENSDNMTTFHVMDTGSGIDSEFHEKIFEHFSKIEKENEMFKPGTGLGLSISKALAELLGGNISVESEPGKGSVFSFSLPCN
jgi:signal transduction histidine kinase